MAGLAELWSQRSPRIYHHTIVSALTSYATIGAPGAASLSLWIGEPHPSPEPCRVGVHDAARPGGLPLAGEPAELRTPAPWRRHGRRPRDPGLGDHPLPAGTRLAGPPGRSVCAHRGRDRRCPALAVLLPERPVGRGPGHHGHRQRQGVRGPRAADPPGPRPL